MAQRGSTRSRSVRLSGTAPAGQSRAGFPARPGSRRGRASPPLRAPPRTVNARPVRACLVGVAVPDVLERAGARAMHRIRIECVDGRLPERAANTAEVAQAPDRIRGGRLSGRRSKLSQARSAKSGPTAIKATSARAAALANDTRAVRGDIRNVLRCAVRLVPPASRHKATTIAITPAHVPLRPCPHRPRSANWRESLR